jgi:hypothetical protein
MSVHTLLKRLTHIRSTQTKVKAAYLVDVIEKKLEHMISGAMHISKSACVHPQKSLRTMDEEEETHQQSMNQKTKHQARVHLR